MRDMLDGGRGRLHVVQQNNSRGHMLTLPSGVHLTTRAEIPGRVDASLGGRRRAWLRSATIERGRGHFGLAHLSEECLSVLLADAVRDDVIVERLFLPEHQGSSLVLAPRAHDGHGLLRYCADCRYDADCGDTFASQPTRHNGAFP